MEEKIKISLLYQLYGKMLTEKQQEIIEDYYNNDLSLSEIAENNDITRQAVRDIIKKSEKKLNSYEKTLGLMQKSIEQKNKIEEIIKMLSNIKKEEIKNIEKELKKLLNLYF